MNQLNNDLGRCSPAEKREWLKRLLAEKAITSAPGGEFPLSYGQRALWFMQKLAPESAFFNLALTCRAVPGFLAEALSEALRRLQQLHPALRTIWYERSGEPRQRVLPSPAVVPQWIDASGWDESELKSRVYDMQLRPFRQEEPLVRVAAFRKAGNDVLLVTMHHLVGDGQSLSIFFDHWRKLYTAKVQGVRADVSPPGANYRDFVESQGEFLQQAAACEAWEFWQRTLGGKLPILRLAAAKPRPSIFTDRGASVPVVFSAPLSAEVRKLARQCRTTLYTVLLAAYQALLHRLGGQEDIIVGSPVSLRSEPRWAEVIGDFINMLPLRVTLSGDPTFTECIQRTRSVVLAALANQQFPFPLMVERLRPPRNSSYSPVFQTIFNLVMPHTCGVLRLFDPDNTDNMAFGPSLLFPYPIRQHEGQYDLALDLTQANDILGGKLKYDPEQFSVSVVRQIADAYLSFLQAATDGPETHLGDFPIPPDIAVREELLI